MHSNQPISPFSGKLPEPEPVVSVALRTEIPAAERALLAGADRRIILTMVVLGVAGALAMWLWKGRRWSAGFALGATLSLLNFQWLRSAVDVITEAMAPPAANSTSASPAPQDATQSRPSRAGAIARFVFRYALIGLAGYAIFLSSAISLTAFLSGLFVSVAALMAEAVYQVVQEIHGSNRVR